jgi:hypothetical protein
MLLRNDNHLLNALPSNQARLQLWVFLLILPGINAIVIAGIMVDIGMFSLKALLLATGRVWSLFTLSLIVLLAVQRLAPATKDLAHFWRQILLHTAAIFFVGATLGPVIRSPAQLGLDVEVSSVAPRVFLLLEIAIYLGVMRFLAEREKIHAERLARRDTELSMLRSQSNPHFLFNTLNLITSEVSKDPAKAREIVFDLSDLLRSNIRLAKRSSVTLEEEFELCELYLRLQKKRFEDRLTFDISIPPEATRIIIPPLLMQPVIENAIKHAVSPYATPAHISLSACLRDSRLLIECRDSGPSFDADAVDEGEGMRILRQTLTVKYGTDFRLALNSTPDGGVLLIDVPAQSGSPADVDAS